MRSTAIRRFAFGGETRAPSWTMSWRTCLVVGRAMFAAIFIVQGIAKLATWDSTVAWMMSEGVPSAGGLLVIATAVELLGGLSILTGTFTRFGALMLAGFLIPTTLIFHDFWAFEGAERQAQMAHFLKNASIFGGLLLLVGFGGGGASVDARLHERRELPERG